MQKELGILVKALIALNTEVYSKPNQTSKMEFL